MTVERAIEILNPEHREDYDSIKTVEEACKMGMEALKKQIPKEVDIDNRGITKCTNCGEQVIKHVYYCNICGQALKW